MCSDNQTLRTQFILFFTAVMCMALAMGVYESIFNNYLSDTFNLPANMRGQLEFPRELPGFLVVVMAGLLWALPVTRLGLVGTLLFILGQTGLVFYGSEYWPMILMMMIASAGQHLLMPVMSTIALSMSTETNRGWRLGQTRAMQTTGTMLGTGCVWLFFQQSTKYEWGFICAAVVAAAAGIIYLIMHIPDLHKPQAKPRFHRKFKLYYILEFLFGARKQIFLTFGFWVLVRIYDHSAPEIARLMFIASAIGIPFKLIAGKAIDRFGERIILVADGLILTAVCIGYGFAGHLGSPLTAQIVASICFILDNLLFTMGTARSTYVSRLTDSKQELTSTLAMGVSINHISSMTIPTFAGIIWIQFGYEWVFAAAALLALIISGVSSLLPRNGESYN
jgi:MFS family permease